jgi:hypothetical protein
MEGSCECGNEPSGSIECWKTIKWLHNWWPLEYWSAPLSCLVMISKFIVSCCRTIQYECTEISYSWAAWTGTRNSKIWVSLVALSVNGFEAALRKPMALSTDCRLCHYLPHSREYTSMFEYSGCWHLSAAWPVLLRSLDTMVSAIDGCVFCLGFTYIYVWLRMCLLIVSYIGFTSHCRHILTASVV